MTFEQLGNLAALVTILTFFYILLFGQATLADLIQKYVRGRPRVVRALLLAAIMAPLLIILLTIVRPHIRVLSLRPVIAQRALAFAPDNSTNQSIAFDPSRSAYTQSWLRSADRYPTSIAILKTPNSTAYFAGTYGDGLFINDSAIGWRNSGLDNIAIYDIAVAEASSRLLVASNSGVYSARYPIKQWDRLAALKGVLITRIAVDSSDNSMILAGTLNGLFRSLDGGETWNATQLPDVAVTSIVMSPINPRRVWLSAIPSTVYRSDDGGNAWTLVNSFPSTGSAPIAIDPDDPDIVYAGPGRLGLFKTYDAGQSWQYIGLGGTSISTILPLETDVEHLSVGTDSGNGVITSANDGQTWRSSVGMSDQVLSLVEDTGIPGTILASTRNRGVLASGDYGINWHSLGLRASTAGLSLSMHDLGSRSDNPNSLLALSLVQEGVFRSDDAGMTWSLREVSNGSNYPSLERIVISPFNSDMVIVSASRNRVFLSMDYGDSWQDVSFNLPGSGFAPVAIAEDGTLYAGPGDQGVWRLVKGRAEWEVTNLGKYWISDLWVSPDRSWLCAYDESLQLHCSTDDGQSWATAPLTFLSVNAHPQSKVLVGVGKDNQVMRSTNAGRTWTNVANLDTTASAFSVEVKAIPSLPNTFVISSDRGLLVSEDGGATWSDRRLPGFGKVFLTPGSRLYLSLDNSLLLSTNLGRDWTTLRSSTNQAELRDIVSIGERKLLAATASDGLFVSEDSGDTWMRTSIGTGTEVWRLSVVAYRDSSMPTALIRHSGRLQLVRSPDGRVWSAIDLPCTSSSNYIGRLLDLDGTEWWQYVCSGESLLMTVNTANSTMHQLTAPESQTVTDARVESDLSGFAIVRTNDGVHRIASTNDGGKVWVYSDALDLQSDWSLAEDRRSNWLVMEERDHALIGVYEIGFQYLRVLPLLLIVLATIGIIVFSSKQTSELLQRETRVVTNRIARPSYQAFIDEAAIPIILVGVLACVTMTLFAGALMSTGSVFSVVMGIMNEWASLRIVTNVLTRVSIETQSKYAATTLVIVTIISCLVCAWIVAALIAGRLAARRPLSEGTRRATLRNACAVALLIGALLPLVGLLPIPYTAFSFNLLQQSIIFIALGLAVFMMYEVSWTATDTVAARNELPRDRVALIRVLLMTSVVVVGALVMRAIGSRFGNTWDNSRWLPTIYGYLAAEVMCIFLFFWRRRHTKRGY